MGTKKIPGAFDCYAEALPDEPMFILLARDESAPGVVEEWASQRATDIASDAKPATDAYKIVEAFECAKAMRAWRQKNNGAWRNSGRVLVSEDDEERI